MDQWWIVGIYVDLPEGTVPSDQLLSFCQVGRTARAGEGGSVRSPHGDGMVQHEAPFTMSEA
jgi:hypothetical protein